MQLLRVWEPPGLAPGRRKGNLARGARVAECAWFEARLGFQRGRQSYRIRWVPKGAAEHGTAATAPVGGAFWADLGSGQGGGGGHRTHGAEGGAVHKAPGADKERGTPAHTRGSRGLAAECRAPREGQQAPAPSAPFSSLSLPLTSNISPMRTQSTRQKPMSAWL